MLTIDYNKRETIQDFEIHHKQHKQFQEVNHIIF